MTLKLTASAILPGWSQGRLLFFASATDPQTSRLNYRAAAATKPGETRVFRTYKAPISAQALAKCQETADNGVALQHFFDTASRGNLDELTAKNEPPLPACAEGENTLIYMCSYFNFLRKYSVDQTVVKHYEARTAQERFTPEAALSIYKILSGHLQPERAAALINADIPDLQNIAGPAKHVAKLLQEAAVIRHDTGATDLAIATMQRAIQLHNTTGKWWQLANFAMASNQPEKAISFYFEAEKMAPLVPQHAMRMARLLLDSPTPEKAAPFLDRAEPAFKAQVAKLRAKSSAKAPQH